MVLAHDLAEGVANGGQEIPIGRENCAVEIELDDCLRFAGRLKLPRSVGCAEFLFRDIVGILHHLHGAAGGVEDRVVESLNPNLFTTLADPPKLIGLEVTGPELGPEFAVGRRLTLRRVYKQRMVLADNFFQPVADGIEEVLVGGENLPVR